MKVRLVRGACTLPVSGLRVSQGDVVEITDYEWEKIKGLGSFLPVVKDEVELGTFPGLSHVVNPREPLTELPPDFTGKTVCLKMVGGVGDAIVCTSVAAALKARCDCRVWIACMPHQIKLLRAFDSVDDAIPARALNDAREREKVDVLIDMAFAFSNTRELVDADYHQSAYAHAGLSGERVRLANLILDKSRLRRLSRSLPAAPIVAIHSGASNPARRWPEDKWAALAHRIRERGASILWLGTHEDFGFTDVGVTQAANVSLDLLDQAALLFGCSYFIGNDSGFAHLAGVMQMPGKVIFSLSKPDSVIPHYGTLEPTEVYTQLGLTPSRSLRNGCEIAAQCMNSISVPKVFNAIPPRTWDAVPHYTQRKRKKKRPHYHQRPDIKNPVETSSGPVQVMQAQVNRRSRILYVLPSLWLGGGELNSANLIRRLAKWFFIDVAVVQQIGDGSVFKPIVDLIEGAIDGQIYFYRSADGLQKLRDHVAANPYDVVVYHEVYNKITQVLGTLPLRPALLRVNRTDTDDANCNLKESRKLFDTLVCVSSHAAREIDDALWIPNGICIDRFIGQPAAPLEWADPGLPVVGYLGRMNPAKGCSFLLEQLGRMRSFNLLLAGFRNENDQLAFERWCKTYDVPASQVQTLEATPNVEPIFRAMDVFALVSDAEGMPSSVLEAAWCDVPTIATRVGALPDMFEDNKSIFFTDVSAEGFEDALARATAPEGAIVAQECRRITRENYTAEHQAENYRKAIYRTMGRTWPDAIQGGHIHLWRNGGIGDVIMATSVVDKVRAMFPHARITVQVPDVSAPIIRASQVPCEIAPWDAKVEADLRFDLKYYDCWKTPGLHAAEAMGGNTDRLLLHIGTLTEALDYLGPNSVGFWPYQSQKSYQMIKQWPDRNWQLLADMLREHGVSCWQLGATFEPFELQNVGDLRKEGVLDSLAALTQLDCIVTIEGVANHAAKALDVSCVVLLGGGGRAKITSYPTHTNVISPTEPPCYANYCISLTHENCDASCMAAITVDEVYKAVLARLF